MYYCDKYNKLYKKLIKNEISVYSFFHDLIPIRYSKLCNVKTCRMFNSFKKKLLTTQELFVTVIRHLKIRKIGFMKIQK